MLLYSMAWCHVAWTGGRSYPDVRSSKADVSLEGDSSWNDDMLWYEGMTQPGSPPRNGETQWPPARSWGGCESRRGARTWTDEVPPASGTCHEIMTWHDMMASHGIMACPSRVTCHGMMLSHPKMPSRDAMTRHTNIPSRRVCSRSGTSGLRVEIRVAGRSLSWCCTSHLYLWAGRWGNAQFVSLDSTYESLKDILALRGAHEPSSLCIP